MDSSRSNEFQIVLGIKEGTGFGFLTNPIIIEASLNGKKLESDVVEPSSVLKFDCQLVWELDQKCFRRLRIENIPLKLECYSILNAQRRSRIGYLLLKLKQGQLISHGNDYQLVERWHRLLGVRLEGKTQRPELLLTFIVGEGLSVDYRRKSEMNANDFEFGRGDSIRKPFQKIHNENDYHQIGDGKECSEMYNFKVTVLDASQLCKMSSNSSDSPKSFSLHFIIFGKNFKTTLPEPYIQKENIILKLRTKMEILRAYFQKFPILKFTLQEGEKMIGVSSIEVKNLIPLGDLNKFITSNNKNCGSVQGRLIFGLENDVQKDAADESKAFIDVILSLDYQGNDSQNELGSTISLDHQFGAGDSSKEISNGVNVNIDGTKFVEHNNLDQHSESPLTNKIEELKRETTKKERPLDIHSEGQKNPSIRLAVSPLPHTVETHKMVAAEGVLSHSDFTRGESRRICEELEDWKEKQQELFKAKLKQKTERHLHRLSFEWMKKQKEIENDFNKRMEQCQTLARSLSEASQELNERTEIILKKEKELGVAQDELDRQYSLKFQQLREASRRYQVDMDHKFAIIENEKKQLLARLEASEKEIEKLKNEKQIAKDGPLTSVQTASLILDMKGLEEKLEAALESKAFFKEQWGRAVREIHKLKEEQQEHLKLQIEKNKLELQKMGLVETLALGEREMKEDQALIENLKSELLQCKQLRKKQNTDTVQRVGRVKFKSDCTSDLSGNESASAT